MDDPPTISDHFQNTSPIKNQSQIEPQSKLSLENISNYQNNLEIENESAHFTANYLNTPGFKENTERIVKQESEILNKEDNLIDSDKIIQKIDMYEEEGEEVKENNQKGFENNDFYENHIKTPNKNEINNSDKKLLLSEKKKILDEEDKLIQLNIEITKPQDQEIINETEKNIITVNYDDLPIGKKSLKNVFTEENMYPTSNNSLESPSKPISIHYDDLPIGKKPSNYQMFTEENMYPPGYNPDSLPESVPKQKPIRKQQFLKKKTTTLIKSDSSQKEENITDPPKEEMKNQDFEEKPIAKSQFIEGSDKTSIIFDERPIGKSSGNQQFIEELPVDQQSFEIIEKVDEPLGSRLHSKVWKIRTEALEELSKDPQIEYLSSFQNFFQDSNANCLEKAIQAYKIYIEQGKAGFDPDILRIILDKVLTNGKTSIRNQAIEALILIFEGLNEKNGFLEVVILLLSSKNQKTVCNVLSFINELLQNFGPQNLNYFKGFSQELEKLALSTVATIRNETMNLYKEIYKWLGDAFLKTMISKLKKSQIDELEKYISETPQPVMKPKKLNLTQNSQNKKESTNPQIIDVYEISESIELFPKYNENYCEKVLSAPKWTDKKDFLEEMIKTINVPRLNASNQSDLSTLVSTLKKLLNDNNANVIQLTVLILGLLSKGLRKNFPYAKMFFPLLLDKFRDKRTALLEELKKTLEFFFFSLNFEEIIEDLKEILTDKSPPIVKINTLGWIDKALDRKAAEGKNLNKFKNALSELINPLKKLTEDGNGEVRDSVLNTIGKAIGCFGEGFMGELQFNAVKLQKINEAASKMPKLKINKPDIEEKIEKNNEKEKIVKNVSQKPPKVIGKSATQKQLIPKIKENTGNNKVSLSNSGSSKNLPEKEDVAIGFEDASENVRTLIGDENIKKIDSNNPKERLEGLQNILAILEENNENFEEVFFVLKQKTKDWKEPNLNVNKEIFNVIQLYSTKIMTKRGFLIISGFVLEKFADNKKFTELCTEFLFIALSNISPKYVIGQLLTPSDSRKLSTKVQQELLIFTQKAIQTIPIIHFPIKLILDYAKSSLSTVQLKPSSLNLIKTLYQYSGKEILKFISDIPGPILKTLNSELESLSILKENEKKFDFKGEYLKEISNNPSILENQIESFPRNDVSNEVNKVLKKLSDPDWKIRREGIDNLEAILSNNHYRISLNGLLDLITILKARLIEKNKNLSKGFIIFTGHLAESVGKDIRPHAKTLLLPLIGNLSDKQGFIRTDTLNSMDKFADVVGPETIINMASIFLSNESPEMRLELINWILKFQDVFSKVDLKSFSVVILNCLLDKNKEIRTSAEIFLEKAVSIIGINEFKNKLQDLKPAAIQQLKPFFVKYEAMETPINSKKDKKKPTIIKKNEILASKGSEKSFKVFTEKISSEQEKSHFQTKIPSQKSLCSDSQKPNSECYEEIAFSTDSMKHLQNDQKQDYKYSPNFKYSPFQQISDQKIQPTFEPNCYISIEAKTLKSKRVLRELSNPWPQEELVDELVSELMSDLKEVVTEELFRRLFSLDFRKHLEACELLKRCCCNEEAKNIREISDLIFKWGFVRVWGNNNPLVMAQILTLFKALLNNLYEQDYPLFDSEANILLGCIKELLNQSNNINLLIETVESITKVYNIDKISCFFCLQLTNQPTIGFKNNVLELFVQVIKKVDQNNLALLGSINEFKENNNLIQILQHSYPNELLLNAGFMFEIDYSSKKSEVQSKSGDIQSKYKQLREKTHELREKTFELQNPIEKPIEQKLQQPLNIDQKPVSKASIINEESFWQTLKSLRTGSITQKIESLLMINEITLSEKEEIKIIMINNSENLGNTLLETMKESFEKRKTTPNQFIQYFLNMVHKLFSLRYFVSSLNKELLAEFAEEMIDRLLSEDENKVNNINNTYDFVKLLNSIMLRMLENSNINNMFMILFDLLVKNRKIGVYSKILGLIIKCILKLTKSIEQMADELKSDLILLRFHEYLIIFGEEALKQDDVGVKAFKTILNEMVKTYGEKIWDSYSAVSNHQTPDNCINKWINMILKPNNMQNSPTLNSSKRTLPEKPNYQRHISPFLQRAENGDKHTYVDETELKRIVENIKRNQNFDESIIKLYELMEKRPGINALPYFLGCSSEFIEFVFNNIDKLRERKKLKEQEFTDRKCFAKNIINNVNYENKEENELQRNSMTFNSGSNNDLDNFQNKINQIKMRYGNMMKTNNENQEEKEIFKEKTLSKNSESIMQRLNDMKNRMQFKGNNPLD